MVTDFGVDRLECYFGSGTVLAGIEVQRAMGQICNANTGTNAASGLCGHGILPCIEISSLVALPAISGDTKAANCSESVLAD